MASCNARLDSTETKNIFLHHISTDIKEIQDAQCNVSTHMDLLGGSSKLAQLLCDHLDHILMHGLYKSTEGYWPCVVFFTHTITVKEIKALVNVNTNIGRGRSWLNIALNEQVMESYLRMFIDNQSHIKFFYAKEAFLRDVERLSLLLTLISGLDFVSFNLPIDEGYLNISASPSVSNSGIDFSVKPSFVAAVTPRVANKRDFTLSDTHATLSTTPSPSHSPLTSSLPPNLHMELRPTIEQQSQGEEWLQEESLSIPLNQTGSGIESESKEMEEKKIVTVATENDIHEIKKSPLPQAKAPQLSFFDRYNQLADQENDMRTEIVSVSKKKKSTKGKKKRKKKDGSSSNEVVGTSKELGKEKRSSSPQSLIESVKENWPPIIKEETPVIKSEEPLVDHELDEELELIDATDDLTKENRIEESIKAVVHDNILSKITDVPNNPFDDFNTLSHAFEQLDTGADPFVDKRTTNPVKEEKEEGRKISYEYEFGGFGSSMSTSDQSSDYNELMDGAAAFVKRKRSPQHTTNKGIERNVRMEDDMQDQGTVDASADSSKLTLDLSEAPNVTYSGPPKRPLQITDSERRSFDVAINDNTRIVLSLDVFHHSNETAVRLVQAYVPQGPGRYQKVCVVVTDGAVYLTQDDGTEGVFSHMMGVSYSMLDSIVIGLSWQWFSLMYKENPNGIIKQQVVITGSEAVTRSVVDTIKETATTSIRLEKDDDARTEAIEKELIKLGSETSMEIVRYCMVYWEQLSGEPPLLSPPADISIPVSGTLSVKTDNLLFIKLQSWSEGFFQLIDGVLHHFNSVSDKSPKSSYPLRGLKCGGCTRAAGENKDYAFKVLDSNGSSLVLAAEDEEDMTRWMQALCLATIGEEEASIKSPIQKGGTYCAVLLTQNKIHVLKEDWSNGTVQLLTSISVQDVNEICVEQALPVYCTLRYDDWENETQGMWMLCFSSEYELGQFERSLLKKYKEIFQVDLEFSELSDSATRSRVHQAIELMRASRNRSDSITRGRTVFSFDQN